MDHHYTEKYEEIKHRIADVVNQKVQNLGKLWKETFEKEIFDQHMDALVGHVTEFFEDVYVESSTRQNNILDNIERLRKEAEDLKRLLGVDIHLTSSPDLPYHSLQMELDQSLEDLRNQLNIRRDHIRSYLEEQQELVESMGEMPRSLPDDPLPTEEDMQNFRRYLDDLKCERLRRMDCIRNLRHSIKIFIEDLKIELQSQEQNLLLYSNEVLPTLKNISKLEKLEQELSQQFEDMKQEIDKYRSKLEQLWEFLQISPSTRQRFHKYTAYNQLTFDVLFQEFNRCESIKRENIEKYVNKVRNEIIHYWDLCYKSVEERERFSPFKSQTYNEDLLTLHEMELNELKEFYEQYKNIYNMYEERLNLWNQMDALEKKKNDPNRYNNRGGQLLREEKERKMINVRIPKIEAQLLEMCAEYQNRTNKPFTIEGKTIEEIIEEDHNKKEEEKAARKKVATPMSVSRYGCGPPPSGGSRPGSALKNMTRSNVMSATRTLSTTKVNATNSNLKRKLSPSSTRKTPAAKRNILTQMSSSNFLRPMGSALKAAPTPPVKSLKRRSIKRMSIKSRRISKRRNENCPGTSDTSSASGHQDSISYDVFENYVSKNTPLRSSVLPGSQSKNIRSVTPKVPHIRITRIASTPSPGGSDRKKLTTKSIPMLF